MPTSSVAHRCMEQICYSVGSCLMQPCESLRPVNPLPELNHLVRPCEYATPPDSLLCAYVSLDDYSLYYQAFGPETGTADCWQGLRDVLVNEPETFISMRVWEQIGYTKNAELAKKSYNTAYENIIASAVAN